MKGGSRSVLNMACERCEDFFKMTRTEMLQSKHLIESRQTLSHTHEKNARVVLCLHSSPSLTKESALPVNETLVTKSKVPLMFFIFWETVERARCDMQL